MRRDRLEESRLEITMQPPTLVEMSAEQRELAVMELAELLLPLFLRSGAEHGDHRLAVNLYWQA